jgi:hypothetical protein
MRHCAHLALVDGIQQHPRALRRALISAGAMPSRIRRTLRYWWPRCAGRSERRKSARALSQKLRVLVVFASRLGSSSSAICTLPQARPPAACPRRAVAIQPALGDQARRPRQHRSRGRAQAFRQQNITVSAPAAISRTGTFSAVDALNTRAHPCGPSDRARVRRRRSRAAPPSDHRAAMHVVRVLDGHEAGRRGVRTHGRMAAALPPSQNAVCSLNRPHHAAGKPTPIDSS